MAPETKTDQLHFSLSEASQVTNVPFFRTSSWIREGLIVSESGGGELGRRRRLGLAGMVALMVVRDLRQRGLSRKVIQPLSSWVSRLTEADIQKAVSKGRTILVADHGSSEVRLVTADKFSKLAAGSVIAIDLGQVLSKLNDKSEESI